MYRTFLIEYRDDQNNYFHKEMTAIVPPAWPYKDGVIIGGLIQTQEAQGFTVYMISEIKGGHIYEDIERMKPRDTIKHMRVNYLDIKKEKGASS